MHTASVAQGREPRPLLVTIVSLDFYIAKPGVGDQARSPSTGKVLKEVPVIRVFGHTDTGQTACTHIHGIFPFFYVQVNVAQIEEIGQEHGREGFLQTFADGLEHAMCLHQTSLVAQRANLAAWGTRDRSYVYDLRWVTGWQSVYGYSNGHSRGEDGEELFIQIWASQPQYVGLMAHLLQQGAVLSTSFQPFEVHLPYLLHFLDSFGLGGMRELVVDPTRIALRGELPKQALSTFPWHPLWLSKLGSSARERLLRRRSSEERPCPWWCDRDRAPSECRLAKSVHPRATTCEVEVDCSATDILPPLASTASEMPSLEAQEATVRDHTRGWICDTLRELWRDEERRCAVLAQPVPWDPAPHQPGVPGPGAAALTPDVMEECMMQRLKVSLEGQRHAALARSIGESVSPGRGSEAAGGAWTQQDVVQADTKCKVSPKFVRALETLEVALSQQVDPPVDEATTALLDQGYQPSDPQEDTATEPETDCGTTELDDLEAEALDAELAAAESMECAPTQLDLLTQADMPQRSQTSMSPVRPADLFPIIADAVQSSEKSPLPPAKGFFSEPDDMDLDTPATEQAGVWEYWQPPPAYEATARLNAKRLQDEEGDDVITKFDNAGRLTTLRRKAATENQGKRLQRSRLASLSEATPPTPAPPKLCQASDSAPLFGTLLTIEVLELPRTSTPQPFQSDTAIGAVAFCIRDERVRSLLSEDGEDYQDGLGLICIEGSETLKIDSDVVVKEVASEVDIFSALTDVFRETDPAVVMGYDVVKGSLGRLISRAQALGLRGFSQDLARAAANSRSGGQPEAAAMSSQVADTHGSPEQAGAPRKLYPPEQLSGGLELPGRLVLNVWRVLRAEAKLPTSSLHTAAEVLLGETLPLLPSEALADRWSSNLAQRALALIELGDSSP
eukprot:s202_g1.t1